MTATIATLAISAFASSHREAPMIAQDPTADITDVYAFRSPEDPSKVVLIMNVIPAELPGAGPNFYRFDDSVNYNIHIDNEGDAVADTVFTFEFTTTYSYPNEFLYNLGDVANSANLNLQQTYTVKQTTDHVETLLIGDGKVAPANVGVNSDPTMGYQPESTTPGAITTSYIKTAGDVRTFAGPRQEGFFVDLERTFDLLNLGNADNRNTLLGYNVHTIAIEVPADSLTRDGNAPSAANQNEVIAIWASTTRPRVRINERDGVPYDYGNMVQVARLGMPLVNEVVIPISVKDTFSATRPRDDAQFLTYVTDPILPIYMEAILGIPDPGSYDAGLGIGGREDLVLAFLTGHPALGTQPSGFVLGGPIPGEVGKTFEAFEALRLNLTTNSGFPNGRLVTDDVVDVALSAMAGLLIDGTFVSDGVDASGLSFLSTFPFLGDPWGGDDHPVGNHDL